MHQTPLVHFLLRSPSNRYLWSALVVLAFISEAWACQICVPIPTKSVADKIIEADAVVLAREDPDQPFHYSIVDTLKTTTTLPPIDLFVDSQTRRLQLIKPEHAAICVWREDGDNPGWERIGSIDDEKSDQVVRDVIAFTSRWNEQPDERIDYFAKLLGSDHPLLGPLAHIEVSRASYGKLRSLEIPLDRQRLRAFFDDQRMIEWHALYILLLAQTGHPEDAAFIRSRFENNARWAYGVQTAAWTAAFIEVEGANGIDRIRELYLANPNRQPEELAVIQEALRVHRDEGRPELHEKVAAAYDAFSNAMSPTTVSLQEKRTKDSTLQNSN